jgi:hypothetical protein
MSMARDGSGTDNRIDSTVLDDTAVHPPEGINKSEGRTGYKP